MKAKAEWAQSWTADPDASFAARLGGLCGGRGCVLLGVVCFHLLAAEAGRAAGLGFANELISRDEGLHCDFACALYQRLTPEERLSDEDASVIITEAAKPLS